MVFQKIYSVYIMANNCFTVLYIGITNNLERRVWEHKNHFNKKSFTAKYNLEILLYYEDFASVEDAIYREKQLKAGSRLRKILLIIRGNPYLKDLARDWY